MALPFILPAIQAGAGIAQAIFGGSRARRAQRELEKLPTPVYTPNRSILDYYNEAKSRYNADPYQSPLYKLQSQQAQRSTAQGLSALNDRGMALAGVNALVQGQNDSMLRAAAAAEQEQSRRFGQLAEATGMKAGEDRQAFQYNQVLPFERKSSLLGAKAAGGNQIMNAGLSNIFGGLQSLGQMKMAYDLYGNQDPESTYTHIPRTRDVRASTYQVPLIQY